MVVPLYQFMFLPASTGVETYHILHDCWVARFADFWVQDPDGANCVEREVIALAEV